MEVNERYIRIAPGKITVEANSNLDLSKDVILEVTGGITKVEECDNQDGTKDLIYVVKLTNINIKR